MSTWTLWASLMVILRALRSKPEGKAGGVEILHGFLTILQLSLWYVRHDFAAASAPQNRNWDRQALMGSGVGLLRIKTNMTTVRFVLQRLKLICSDGASTGNHNRSQCSRVEYVPTFVCIRICMNIYVYMYICIHTYVCPHVWIHTYTHTYLHKYMHTCNIYIYICVCMYICSCICIYIYTYTDIIYICTIYIYIFRPQSLE